MGMYRYGLCSCVVVRLTLPKLPFPSNARKWKSPSRTLSAFPDAKLNRRWSDCVITFFPCPSLAFCVAQHTFTWFTFHSIYTSIRSYIQVHSIIVCSVKCDNVMYELCGLEAQHSHTHKKEAKPFRHSVIVKWETLSTSQPWLIPSFILTAFAMGPDVSQICLLCLQDVLKWCQVWRPLCLWDSKEKS